VSEQSPHPAGGKAPNDQEQRTLLDAIRSTILFCDARGVIVDGNSQARQWRPFDQLLGKTFVDLPLQWDEAPEKHNELLDVIRTGNPVWGSRERAEDDGGEYWFSVDKIPTYIESCGADGAMLVISDITESVQREKALRESESRYRAYIANSADAIWRYGVVPPVDTSLPVEEQIDLLIQRSILVECNERLARLFGASHVDDVIGMRMYRNGSLSNRHDLYQFVTSNYRVEDREFARINYRGERVYMQSSAIGIVENGFLVRAWGTTRDVTEQKRYLDRMKYLANHDALTSLPNRTLLYKRMEEYVVQRKSEQKMALLLIDLDRFKEINDTLGHATGDQVLKLLGPRLEAELGDVPGIVARLGGDEFAIFLPNIRNRQQAIVFGHRFLDSVCQVFELEGFRTEISASVGVSICPDQAEDVSALMRYADVAMYHAKTTLQGVAIYDSDYDPHSAKRLELMGALGRAIRENQLLLHFQPKVSLSSNRIYAVEALLRWNHPEIGFVPPGEFIPIAEMSNLIYPMTLWVLERSMAQAKVWLEQGCEIGMAVNLSVRNLLDDRIVQDLDRLLKQYRLPGHLLELEITESMIMSDPSRAQRALARINALGVGLSIDDFGTGYSSLAYLKRLPVQTLKIDYSFIRGMEDNEQDQIIVNSTIQLAHNLGLSVVAEGVETRAIYERLQDLGCDNAQGYYVARPMPADQVGHWLSTSAWGMPEVELLPVR
jgi:diguanylate cyclase (GGDEF)-like protein/PAS domain S-box-containing protein